MARHQQSAAPIRSRECVQIRLGFKNVGVQCIDEKMRQEQERATTPAKRASRPASRQARDGVREKGAEGGEGRTHHFDHLFDRIARSSSIGTGGMPPRAA